MQMVNLLPWRARRQRRCLRFWLTAFSLTLLLIVLLAALLRVRMSQESQRLRLMQQAGITLQAGLAQRQTHLLARQAERQAEQQRGQRLQATREWRHTLIRLANALPEQAWLTELRYQQGTLALTGYALSFMALNQLEAALSTLPGLRPGKPGAASRDAQGRWQFGYALVPDVSHAPQR